MEEHRALDEELLMSILSEFAHTLASRFEVSEVLYRLAEHVVQVLDVDGTGVSVIDEEGKLRPVTVINELTRKLEAVQEEHQKGPCVDAFREGRIVVVNELSDQAQAWPTWCSQAEQLGIRSVLGIPLMVNDDSLGAMNIYSQRLRHWRDVEVRAARVLADMAASYVANASDLQQSRRTTEQLREALESRIIIEQAKGVLAGEGGCTVDEAFKSLRDHSRRHGASMRTVAEAVVNLGLRPARRSSRSR